MVRVVLPPGSGIVISFGDTEGEVIVIHEKDHIRLTTEMGEDSDIHEVWDVEPIEEPKPLC